MQENGTDIKDQFSCFTIIDGEWILVEIPDGTRRLRIGKDIERCDFPLDHPEADDIQVVIQKVGKTWYIIERGPNDLMLANGFPKRQTSLKSRQTAVIQVGEAKFIFSTHKLQKPDEDEAASLQDSQYSLEFKGIRKNFNLKQNCLIGSDPMCDFHLPVEDFAAMISNLGKRLFLTGLADKIIVEADGKSNVEHIPLVNGSKIHIGNFEINFELSKDLSFTQKFDFVPDTKDACLRLLQIDENGGPGESYVLPPTGRTITIGRSSAQCLIGISNSSQISRIHAQGIIYDKNVIIVDNQTTNGTFVNGKRIKKRKCYPGDIIKFGEVKFILCYVG